jgi:signal transduction histidine kinase
MVLFGTLMIFVVGFSACAQPSPTVIPDDFSGYDLFEYDLSKHWSYLPDSENLTAAEAFNQLEFFLSQEGLIPESSWRFLQLINQSEVEDFSIRFMSQHNRIRIVKGSSSALQVAEDTLGIQVYHTDVSVMPRLMSYEFVLQRGDSVSLMFQGDFSTDSPPVITLNQARQVQNYSDHYDRLSYVFSAVFLMMLLYNMSILLIVRDRSYAYYSMMAFGYFLHAFNYQLEYWFTPLIASHFTVISATLISIGGMGFWATFLSIKKGLWSTLWRFVSIAGIALVLLVIVSMVSGNVSLSSFQSSSIVAAVLGLISILSWTISSVIFTLRGLKNARLFLLANLPLAVGALFFLTIWSISRFTEIHLGSDLIILTNYIFFGSLAVQMLLFSVAIGYSIKMAAAVQLASEEKQRLLLQTMVNERTTELKRINEELSQKNNELEQSNGTKNRLLTILSHDLRSPINNVASLVTLLKEHQFSPEEFSSLIPELEKRLSETTNFMSLLLQWTQSQNDGLVANKTRFDLQPVISKSVEHLASSLEAKQLKLKAHVEDFEVFADQNMIDLVIRNLLSNAIKFSNPNGKIEISAVKEVNEMVSIHVVDYGVGIDEKRTELFFDVSQKNTTLGTAREKGFGMGLILCKDFVELNGGALIFSSEKGKGSTFSVSIPS